MNWTTNNTPVRDDRPRRKKVPSRYHNGRIRRGNCGGITAARPPRRTGSARTAAGRGRRRARRCRRPRHRPRRPWSRLRRTVAAAPGGTGWTRSPRSSSSSETHCSHPILECKDISLVNHLPISANFWALREPSCLDLPLLKHGLMASCPLILKWNSVPIFFGAGA